MLRYKDYTLLKPNPDIVRQINNLIENKDGSIFHHIELNEIVEKEFNSELFYLVDNEKTIQHASVVHVTKNKFGYKDYSFKPLFDIPYAGFIGDKVIDIEDINVNHLETFTYAGFPYYKESEDLDLNEYGKTVMVDITLSEDDIFANVINSKRRNMIRKALKAGIKVKPFFEETGLELFRPMLNDLHIRLGYKNLTFSYYQKLFAKFAKNKQAFILIAFKKNKPISGLFVLGNKNYMHYYKGATISNAINEGQGELLQWEAIKISKKLGAGNYDLCNINKEKLPSIYRFKTGISSQIYEYQKYSYRSLGFKILNSISR